MAKFIDLRLYKTVLYGKTKFDLLIPSSGLIMDMLLSFDTDRIISDTEDINVGLLSVDREGVAFFKVWCGGREEESVYYRGKAGAEFNNQ